MSELLVAQLYCKVCGHEAYTAAIDCPCPVLYCTGCGAQWWGSYAIEQINIAFAELTDWEWYDFFGEVDLSPLKEFVK